jgi:hypothetical protein
MPYCCEMRRHFLLGIVAELEEPPPVDVVDFVVNFETEPTLIALRYCPFCGLRIQGDSTLRVPR